MPPIYKILAFFAVVVGVAGVILMSVGMTKKKPDPQSEDTTIRDPDWVLSGLGIGFLVDMCFASRR